MIINHSKLRKPCCSSFKWQLQLASLSKPSSIVLTFIFTVRSSGECQLNGPFLHNNNVQLSSPSGGTFSSPSYPSHYPNNMLCTWKIMAPSGKRVKLYFNYFRLESGVCSSNDYLEVRDGSSSTSLKKGTYCGSYAPTVTSSGRECGCVSDLTLNRVIKGFRLDTKLSVNAVSK